MQSKAINGSNPNACQKLRWYPKLFHACIWWCPKAYQWELAAQKNHSGLLAGQEDYRGKWVSQEACEIRGWRKHVADIWEGRAAKWNKKTCHWKWRAEHGDSKAKKNFGWEELTELPLLLPLYFVWY